MYYDSQIFEGGCHGKALEDIFLNVKLKLDKYNKTSVYFNACRVKGKQSSPMDYRSEYATYNNGSEKYLIHIYYVRLGI